MAPDTTPPSGATRYIQTTCGLLSYSQLAPLLAERVLRVERDIAAGGFGAQPLCPELILGFHREIAGDLCPEWAGQWRNAEVRVGEIGNQCPSAGAGSVTDKRNAAISWSLRTSKMSLTSTGWFQVLP